MPRAAWHALLVERDVDAALVTRLVNVRYLTGFTGSNGAVLVTSDAAILATDGRYLTQSAEQAPDVERVIEGAVTTVLAERAVQKEGVKRLAIEEHDVTLEMQRALAKATESAELGDLRHAVERLREVKDDDEVAALREACAIADRAFADLLPSVTAGRSEKDIGWDLEVRMRGHGADAPSFETIVASGPNSAIPHHRPTERVVQAGDLLKFDFGALFDGYHSDMTRTVIVGPAADWQRDLYELVAKSQAAGRAALAPGAVTGDVDAAARDVIDEAGYAEEYLHSLGHGVGLEIHEAPTLRKGGADTLGAGMPVTVEPGVYLAGRGGVRIEDTLVVREDGPELLTTTTKELLVL